MYATPAALGPRPPAEPRSWRRQSAAEQSRYFGALGAQTGMRSRSHVRFVVRRLRAQLRRSWLSVERSEDRSCHHAVRSDGRRSETTNASWNGVRPSSDGITARFGRLYPCAYRSAAALSNSKATTGSSPTTQASWPGRIT